MKFFINQEEYSESDFWAKFTEIVGPSFTIPYTDRDGNIAYRNKMVYQNWILKDADNTIEKNGYLINITPE